MTGAQSFICDDAINLFKWLNYFLRFVQKIRLHRFFLRDAYKKGAFFMSTITLIQINQQGRPLSEVGKLDDIARQVCAATTLLYAGAGFVPPWIGYLAQHEGKVVGACAFKTPPVDGKVEIGYFTFPDWEEQGIGTSMVRALLEIVQAEQTSLTVVAQTANEENASNVILRKFGFALARVVEDTEDGEMWEWHWNKDNQMTEQKGV